MESNKPLDEKDLNKLLNDLFVQENSGIADEASAHFVFSQEYDVKADPKKEKELLNKLKNSSGGYWNYMAITLIALILVAGGFIYFKILQSENTKTNQDIQNKQPAESSELNTSEYLSHMDSVHGADTNLIPVNPNAIPSDKQQSLSEPGIHNIQKTSAATEQETAARNTSAIPAGKLKIYDNEKIRMIERLVNADKGLYSSVEEGKISYRGEEAVIEPFVLRNQTITNLEYKIFLTDLLQNGKIQDYLKASVKTEVWNNYSHNVLAINYFANDRYNNFPVVNISTEGAVLFCQWLETEVNSYLQQHKSKSKIKIRLPFDSEWIFATKRGYVHFPDCDGYNTVYDRTEGIVDAHYLKWTAQIKKRDKKHPNELDEPLGTNRYGMNEKQVLQLFEKGEKAASKLNSDSLYPFRIDVYNKVAHVSEIIYTHGSVETTVIGSCWKSKKEYLQMMEEFQKASASPYVGFRIVVLNGNKASYKAPFW